jgi:glycosyltransferase involved in cell wall biosynthesis
MQKTVIDKLVVLHEYGAPRHFLALNNLQKEGFLKEIQSVEFNIPVQIASGMRYFNKTKLSRAYYNIKELSKLLFKENQVIIIGAAPLDPIIPFLKKLKQKNKIIYFTSWPFWDGERWVKKPLLSTQKDAWYDFLMDSVSVGVTEAACKGVESHGSRSFYIPHAVDTQIFEHSLTKSEKTIVLFVGGLTYRKGMSILLDVIRATKWPNNTEFWFVGDGPFKPQVTMMGKNYPVRYIGYISDEQKLASIYRQADIFVLPSIDGKDIENFGVVLIEAMASGLPVVTTDCMGPKEIVNNNYDGYVIPQKNKGQLREKIINLIENPDMRIKMGRNGRKKAEEVYSVKRIAEKWKNVIKLVME